MTLTPLQRDILVILQSRQSQADIKADLHTLEEVFIDTLTDRTVILTALSQLVTRGFLCEDQGRWLLTEAGEKYSRPSMVPSRR
jgi:hypothetical protein